MGPGRTGDRQEPVAPDPAFDEVDVLQLHRGDRAVACAGVRAVGCVVDT